MLPTLLALLGVLVIALADAAITLLVLWRRTRGEADALAADLEQANEELRRARPRPSASRSRSVRAVRQVVETAVESASRLREGGVSRLVSASIEDLTRWALEEQGAIRRLARPGGEVAICFTDIEDSTGLNEELGDAGFARLLEAHDQLIRRAVERHHGHLVKTLGDGAMMVFTQPADAVRAAIDIQDELIHGRAPRLLRRTPLRVRTGVHAGEAVERDGDYFGRNVAIAARVADLAEGGQILVTDQIRQELRDQPDILLVDFREAELRGVPGTHRVWQVALL